MSADADSGARWLRTPEAIRERAASLLAVGLRGELKHFAIELERMPEVARRTAEITRQRYPDLRVPPHSRFAHFDAGAVARTARIERELSGFDARERARRLCELAVASVLLDAGAGARWAFVEPETGARWGRSEGLALASLAWMRGGGLSGAHEPYRVDAAGLTAIDARQLMAAFQVQGDNQLVGVEGRLQLLAALGRVLRQRSDVFGADARVGGMVDWLAARADAGRVSLASVFALITDALAEIWPGRLRLGGLALGDVWHHAAVGGEGVTRGMIPFHKLSQWLSYSLLHPLAAAGLTVTELDGLTGLAEYRNGGLFVDLGVLVPKHDDVLRAAHSVDSELVVEWRGLTVALLDRVAPLVRSALGVSEAQLPLCAVLEGGTWAAGRAIAAERRPDASPPIRVVSDGTVF